MFCMLIIYYVLQERFFFGFLYIYFLKYAHPTYKIGSQYIRGVLYKTNFHTYNTPELWYLQYDSII